MYLTIREYQAEPTNVNEILKQDEKSFVPSISRAAGFRDYFCIDGGNGTLTSVSLFENRADGEKFNVSAMNWVQEHLGSLLPTTPKVTSGEVRTHATGKVLVS
ncbi:MAG: hypothetical protein DLM70_04545 [Chloroflexi bacterium]|nr:MAG: hypothetical protein DLM70_04545 [Chloroflexota bacterium]